MARYTGAVCHKCRYLDEKLMLKGEKCYTPKCPLEKRRPPSRKRPRGRRRVSERGTQLREKQKVRFSYGVLEQRFRRLFTQAMKAPGITGNNLFILLERRLDNTVYRLGFADSRAQARQIVQHGHIAVNNHRVNIPSYLVKEGDAIKWQEASTKTEYYKTVSEKIKQVAVPDWLSLDQEKMSGIVLALPDESVIDAKFNSQAIVEYYSR
ncbi:MAG: 30S ribosomal protein S4 [Chloroflexota bacterium]|nr:30S ribosomal protein S4 [Chloroflexota bacterium]